MFIIISFKDFHIPFMTLENIGFKVFAKITRGSCCCVFVDQVVQVLTLQAVSLTFIDFKRTSPSKK